MSDKVSPKTYQEVMEKYEGKCQRPGCSSRVTEYSHIIFRSESKKWIDHPGNGVPLCAQHHRLGKDSVHMSRWWRMWYYKFLPAEIRMTLSPWHLNYCLEHDAPS